MDKPKHVQWVKDNPGLRGRTGRQVSTPVFSTRDENHNIVSRRRTRFDGALNQHRPQTSSSTVFSETSRYDFDHGRASCPLSRSYSEASATVHDEGFHPLSKRQSQTSLRSIESATNRNNKPLKKKPSITNSEKYALVSKPPKKKIDLSIYLPRRSFYSSHDAVLKNGGYPKPNDLHCLRSGVENCRQLREKLEEEMANQTDILDQYKHKKNESIAKDMQHKDPEKPARKMLTKNVLTSSNSGPDISKLLEYLIMVREKPEEYKTLQQVSPLHTKISSIQSLIKTGRAYNRGHHNFGQPESLVIKAAFELGCRHSHPAYSKYEQLERLRIQIANSKSKHGQNKTNGGTEFGGKAEENVVLTDMERKRGEAERLMHSLTTLQAVRAREMAIKEMGERDKDFRRWWLADRYCRYLRKKGKSDEYNIG